jgi:phosphomannomutase
MSEENAQFETLYIDTRRPNSNERFLNVWGAVQEPMCKAGWVEPWFPSTLKRMGFPISDTIALVKELPYETRVKMLPIVRSEAYLTFAEYIANIFCVGASKIIDPDIQIILGHDNRSSNIFMYGNYDENDPTKNCGIQKGVYDSGIQGYNAGISPLPVLEHYSWKHGMIMLSGTSSHLTEKTTGGIQERWYDGSPLFAGGTLSLGKLIEMARSGEFNRTLSQGWQPIRKPIKNINIMPEFISFCRKDVKMEDLQEGNFAMEAFEGTGNEFYNDLFADSQVNIINVRNFEEYPVKINFKTDHVILNHPYNPFIPSSNPKAFTNPDPLKIRETWLTRLSVLQYGCKGAFVHDKDADRIGIYDENGDYIRSDIVQCIVLEQIAAENNGSLGGEKIYFEPRSMEIVEETILKLGGKPICGPSGKVYVYQVCKEENILYAAETSCHHTHRDFAWHQSPTFAQFYTLKAMKRTKMPLSELAKRFRTTFPSGEIHVSIPNDEAYEKCNEWTRRLAKKYGKYIANTDIRTNNYLVIKVPGQFKLTVHDSYVEAVKKINLETYNFDVGVSMVNDIADELSNLGLLFSDIYQNYNNPDEVATRIEEAQKRGIGYILFKGR